MQDKSKFIYYAKYLRQNVESAHEIALSLKNKNYFELEKDLRAFFGYYFYNFESFDFFGSRSIGLATSESSNLDIHITLRNVDMKDFLRAWNLLSDVSENFAANSYDIEQQKIEVLHRKTGTTCNLDFKPSGLVSRVSCALTDWIELQSSGEARLFLIFIRNWFELSSSFDKKYLEMLDMLSIFWMIRKNLVPPFFECQEYRDSCYNIRFRSHHSSYYDNDHMFDFTDYIQGFFSYFSNFNWEKKIVCPYTGTAIYKDYVQHHPYLNWRSDIYELNIYDPMIVLSFLQLSTNYAIGIDEKGVSKFVEFCQQSHYLLSQNNI